MTDQVFSVLHPIKINRRFGVLDKRVIADDFTNYIAKNKKRFEVKSRGLMNGYLIHQSGVEVWFKRSF